MDMRDIAKLAGVSSATVSRVINGSHYVRPETAERVRKVVEEARYVPKMSAATLKYGRSSSYGLIVPDITNPLFPEFIKCFEAIAVGHGQEMLMASTDSKASRLQLAIRRMLIRQVDGIALLASEIETESFEALAHHRVPLVTLDRRRAGVGLSDIAVDSEASMVEALQYLKGLRHKKIGYIGGSEAHVLADHRRKTFFRAMKHVGLTVNPSYVKPGDALISEGSAAMTDLMSMPEPPTAVFAASDLMAIAATRSVHQMGLKVPQDVSIIGFGDIDLGDIVQPPLTTLRLSRATLASRFFEALEHLKNTADPQGKRYKVRTSLVLRESTGLARGPRHG